MRPSRGALLALPFLALAAWACGKRPALPDTPEARGLLVFKSVCTNCHTLTGSGKAVGPDLLDVLKRRDEAFIRAYVANPRSLNPQAQMPRYGLAAEDVDGVVAFLKALPASLRPEARP